MKSKSKFVKKETLNEKFRIQYIMKNSFVESFKRKT